MKNNNEKGFSLVLLIMLLVFLGSAGFYLSYKYIRDYVQPVSKGATQVLPNNPALIVVDHNSVALFDQIPDEYITRAKNIRMLFIDRSVGGNIDYSLNCLAYPSVAAAPTSCKRPDAATAGFTPNAKYNRDNWDYLYWTGGDCGMWYDKIKCFRDMIAPVANNYDVMSYQNSYLEVSGASTISDPQRGYFGDNRYDIADMLAIEAQYPTKKFIYWTSSLARGIGTAISTDFNEQMRNYARSHNKILFDVADIESHDVDGSPCYDNRDGVPYLTENNPDDGIAYPAICASYTSETEGGHLGSQATGGTRIAKAFWVLMAQMAGWNPGTPPTTTPPTNAAPVVNAGADTTGVVNTNVQLAGTATDDGRPNSVLLTTWSSVSGPAVVTFGSANTLATTARFSVAGTYTLRFTANDGELSSYDEVRVVVSTAPTTPPTTPQPTTGTFYLSFDNATSHAGCTACVNYSTSLNSAGLRNSAYSFNGTTSYVEVKNFDPLFGTQQFTLSVWVRPQFDETSTGTYYIFNDYSGHQFMYLGPINDWRVGLRTTAGTVRLDTLNLNWDPNTWNHLVVVYTGSEARIYWNGVLKNSIAITNPLVLQQTSSFVGVAGVKSGYFLGSLDEFNIFNRAYTAAEVQNLYNAR